MRAVYANSLAVGARGIANLAASTGTIAGCIMIVLVFAHLSAAGAKAEISASAACAVAFKSGTTAWVIVAVIFTYIATTFTICLNIFYAFFGSSITA